MVLMGEELERRCNLPSCSQTDFLPFTCDCCTRVFCLEHRTYDAHSCPSAGAGLGSTLDQTLRGRGRSQVRRSDGHGRSGAGEYITELDPGSPRVLKRC
jgi:hypothetical protein